MALGNEVDLHTPNMESASVDWLQRNQNAVMLLPGDMETSDVQLTAEGRWVFQCRVADHISAGELVHELAAHALPYSSLGWTIPSWSDNAAGCVCHHGCTMPAVAGQAS